MGSSSNNTMKITGIALMVLGIGLTVWGYQEAQSAGSQFSRIVTGSDTDKVMMLYISGAVSCVVGLYLYVTK